MKPKRPVYLASDSPRRKELMLQLLGHRFKTCKHEHIEENNKNLSPRDLVLHHALSKARSAAKKISSGVIIGADTVVVCRNKVLGKPHTKKEAVRMLRFINNKNVLVLSAVAVADIENKKEFSGIEKTKVKIKKMTEEEIVKYAATKEPLDKAGAFGIQGRGAFLVEDIKGDYFNVVGLPLFKLNHILKKLGVSIF